MTQAQPPEPPRGQRIARLDLQRKITGQPIYASDIRLPGMLHAKLVHSPLPHARITRLSAGAAAELPGFVALVGRQDVKGNVVRSIDYPGLPPRVEVFPEVCRYNGEAVAAVVAETEDDAIRAAELVEIDSAELPTVATAEEALAPDAPKIFPDGNLASSPYVVELGDPERALREADHVFEGVYFTQRQAHATIEPVCCVAAPEGGRVVIWTVTDSPFKTRQKTAELLGLPEEAVHVVSTAGATYGNKNILIPSLEPVCALLALKTGCPVRLALSSEEMFHTIPTRHAVQVTLKTGVMSDGRMVARTARAIVDTGAWGMGGRIVASMGTKFVDLYPVEHLRYEGIAVHTNNLAGGAYRGVATPQIHFAMETQVNEIAKALGIDPVELRQMNMVKTGHRLVPGGTVVDAGPLQRCLTEGAEVFAWNGERPERHADTLVGRGIAIGMHHTGLGGVGKEGSTARLVLSGDGTVEVFTAVVDKGQGAETALAQIAAAALGADIASIGINMGDTDSCPWDEFGAEVNRGTYIGGLAVRNAALQLRSLLEEVVGTPLPLQSGERAFSAVVERWRDMKGKELPQIVGSYTPQEKDPRPVFSAHFAEVEIDRLTGDVRVLRYVAAQDLGEVINPDVCESQIEGGVYHQVGYALREELVASDGTVQNGNFMEYSVGGVGERVPVTPVLIETPGVPPKGVGTSAAAAVAPAVIAAIADAIGAFIHQLPATPERVLEALETQRAKTPGRVEDVNR